MREAARARGRHTKTVVPRLADHCRGTPSRFGEGTSNARAGGMKSKQLDIDARPICESGGGRMFAKGSVVSQPGVALKFAVRAQNQEFIKC